MIDMSRDYKSLPDDLPVPVDDGAADGLVGRALPDLALPSTTGGELRLSDLALPSVAGGEARPSDQPLPATGDGDPAPPVSPARLLIAYLYPMTGTPGQELPHGWDDIPGARGCTPQSCAYRDAVAEFERHGAAVVGISAQSAAEQAEFAAREHIPFPLLSDDRLQLAAALGLPTFEVEGRSLYRRLTFVAAAGRIVKVFYPVFPPDRDAAAVLAWLGTEGAGR
jgi:peroxiredoxin